MRRRRNRIRRIPWDYELEEAKIKIEQPAEEEV